MQNQILIQELTNGVQYKATNSEGEEYTVNRPSTSVMLKAARTIQKLSAAIAHNTLLNKQLTDEIATLKETLNAIKSIQDTNDSGISQEGAIRSSSTADAGTDNSGASTGVSSI